MEGISQKRWQHTSRVGKQPYLLLSILVVLLLIINTGLVSAFRYPPTIISSDSSLSYTFYFDDPLLSEVSLENQTFTRIDLNDCYLYSEPGFPALPFYPAQILLPQETMVNDIQVTVAEEQTISLEAPVMPEQESVRVGMNETPPFQMNASIYSSTSPVFTNQFESQDIGYCRGYAILTVYLFPLQYVPVSGSITFFAQMTITLDLQPSEPTSLVSNESLLRDNNADEQLISGIVDNPSILDTYESISEDDIAPLGGETPLDGAGLCNPSDEYQYVIITSNSLKSTTGYAYNWTSLINHRKTFSNLNGVIVTVQEIDACQAYWNTTTTFNDSQAHIREFCKDAYLNWNTEYILLGGDWDSTASHQIVPYRLFTDREETDTYNTMACDMYYSHLDGTWYYTAQSIWGGGRDSGANDYYSELFIGRIAAYNASMISNAIEKIIWYDLEASGDWLHQASFLGGNLGWSATSKQYMEELRLGTDTYRTFTGFEEWNAAAEIQIDTTERLYHADLGANYQAYFSNSIENDNASIINHLDHSDWNTPFGLPQWGYRYNTKPFFGYSQGCLAGRFHAGYAGSEQLQCRHHERHAFGLVLNTGYGYGSSGSTNGASQDEQCYFWDYFFNNQSDNTQNWQLGKALAYAQEKMSAKIDVFSHAWCYAWYSAHLFGDPAQTLRLTNTPPASIQVSNENPSSGSTSVSITTPSLSIQIEHALGQTFDYTIHTTPNIGSITVTDSTNGTKTCTITGLAYTTTYTWYVNATDGTNWTNKTYTFTTENAPVNNPPVLTNPNPQNGATTIPLTTTSLSITIQDAEGDQFDWSITTAPNIGTNSGTSSLNGTKTCSITGLAYSTTYSWFAHAYDGHHWTNTTYTFTTQDEPINNPATITTPSPANGSTSVPISQSSITILIQDPEGDLFNWTITTNPNIGTAAGTSATNGTKTCTISGLSYATCYSWIVRAYDGHHWTNRTYSFTTIPNSPTIITSPSPNNASNGVSINLSSLSITIQDPEGDSLAWSITTSPDIGSANGTTAAANGTITCTISDLDYSTLYTWIVRVYDGHPWTNKTCHFTTEIQWTNTAPTLTSPNPGNQTTGIALSTTSLSIQIQDVDGDHFNWTIITQPNIGQNLGNSSTNGTKTCPIASLAYATTYTWFVHVADGISWTNATYIFTTQEQSSGGPSQDEGQPDIEETPIENTQPQTPSRPTGTVMIEPGQIFSYSSLAIDNEGDQLRYRFDWGDGTTSSWSSFIDANTSLSMSHAWTINGTFQIRVLAQDYQGLNSSWSPALEISINTITSIQNQSIQQDITKQNTTVNQAFSFDASALCSLEGVVLLEWDFGDGTNGTGPNPSHAYAKPGTYLVNLTTTDANGETQTRTMIITVTASSEDIAQAAPNNDSWIPLYVIIGIITILLIALLMVYRRRRSL